MRPTPERLLKQAKIRRFLVSNLTNIHYLTGVEMSAGALLVSGHRYFLFADARYREMASLRARRHVVVLDIESFVSVFRKIRRCGFESQSTTVSKLLFWKRKYKNTKFVPTEGIVEEFRRAKDQEELRFFIRAQRITREMLRRIPATLRSRPTEKQLAWKLKEWAFELGADDLAFDPIVAFGTHTSRPHHHSTDRRLLRGHIVQIDVGTKFHGYCSDQSRVFFTAPPTVLQRRVYDALLRAKEAAETACRVGASTRALDTVARDLLREEGLDQYFTHALGHGVGLEIHEGVSLSIKAPDKNLLRNEIVTIEPGIYIPGRFGMRIEDEIIVR